MPTDHQKENPKDPTSLAYILREIIGNNRGAIQKAGKILHVPRGSMPSLVVGRYLPTHGVAESWPHRLSAHYDLDRLCKISGLTLRKKLENKIATLRVLDNRTTPVNVLLYKIGGEVYNFCQVLSHATGLPYAKIGSFVSTPEQVSSEWSREIFLPAMQAAYPDKKDDIALLKILLFEPRTSVASFKKQSREEILADFQTASGLLIRELREKCADSVEAVEGRFKAPVLKGKLGTIEEGKPLRPSIYWSAIGEICSLYSSRPDPQIAGYINMLHKMQEHFRPR